MAQLGLIPLEIPLPLPQTFTNATQQVSNAFVAFTLTLRSLLTMFLLSQHVGDMRASDARLLKQDVRAYAALAKERTSFLRTQKQTVLKARFSLSLSFAS